MKLGIVIHASDSETVWNAFRLGVYARQQGDVVTVFLLAKGVECEALDSERFPVRAQMQELIDHGGAILACGTCLKLRHSEGSALCPLSTLERLVRAGARQRSGDQFLNSPRHPGLARAALNPACDPPVA